MIKKLTPILLFLLVFSFNTFSQEFDLVKNEELTSIYYQQAQDSVVANLLAKDIKSVTGKSVLVTSDLKQLKGNAIVLLQTDNSSKISNFKGYKSDELAGKSEVFSWQFLNQPNSKIKQALVITGSDARGLAYGVFKLSEQIGVNAWYYWADVTPSKKEQLSISTINYTSKEPSVNYRGIFINDEDWGLRPWAASQIDTDIKNVGPKAYEKVFEVLLRLKANTIWPAMHPETTAFFKVPGNLEMAKKYNIIIGTSHAEPMLRNNVDEWDEKTMGNFNYITNKSKVQEYWSSRLKESAKNDVIYSMGMRGVHDSGMEGAKSTEDAVALTQDVLKDQSEMLSSILGKKKIRKAITLYKEVLNIYDAGLKVPDDITLVWPDDNYGYIRRLNNEQEAKRPGSSGVYYHASYWGRPHDYLWLSTTPAGLMREEMVKAYRNNSKKMWILNVGDIKPAEYQIQLFMDMAYDVNPFQENEYLEQHRKQWFENIFSGKGNEIANIMSKYEQLALERKPEFMGWSQTEPTTKTGLTAYNHFYYGDEAQQRINQYQQLENEVKALGNTLSNSNKDAFFELVKYPVFGASNMNKKFLYHDKAVLYAKQGRLSADNYKDSVHTAYQNIVKLTQYFNDTLANGKWKNMMSMKPRGLPVYEEPASYIEIDTTNKYWGLIVEGQSEMKGLNDTLSLPDLYAQQNQKFFFDVFLTQENPLNWKISTNKKGLIFSANDGFLNVDNKKQERVWVSLDPNLAIKEPQEIWMKIQTSSGDKYMKVKVFPAEKSEEKVFKEMNGYVSIFAENYSTIKSSESKYWNLLDGLGYTNKVMQSVLKANSDDDAILAYNFVSSTETQATINIFTVPSLPINSNYSLKYAVRIDDGKWEVQDFATKERSNAWKQNVLSNISIQKVKTNTIKSGKHTLQIKLIDPEVMIDRFVIDFGGYKPAYSKIAETK